MTTQRKRILFVDDEPAILSGIANVLHRDRKSWDLAFALGGEAALVELRTSSPIDVVISDMRMPVMDGFALLALIARESPHTMRILLSGSECDSDSWEYHERLVKPCSATLLRAAIERALDRQIASPRSP
jgi:CheY-like chemotaxis protein